MTVAEFVAEVQQSRGSQFTTYRITSWLNEIETKVYDLIINKNSPRYIPFTPYNYDTDGEKELAVPNEHCDIYETYVFAKIDYFNNEIDAYNADSAMHSAAWDEYASKVRRGYYGRCKASGGEAKSPKIVDGMWMVWNDDLQMYVGTGVKAKGFSPIVTATRTENGVTITVQDDTHTDTVTVYDGTTVEALTNAEIDSIMEA